MAAQIVGKANGKKYAVISEELYKYLRSANQRAEQTESPEFQKVKTLDDKIQEILTDKTISDERKAKLYSMIAGKYLSYRRKAPEITIATDPMMARFAPSPAPVSPPPPQAAPLAGPAAPQAPPPHGVFAPRPPLADQLQQQRRALRDQQLPALQQRLDQRQQQALRAQLPIAQQQQQAHAAIAQAAAEAEDDDDDDFMDASDIMEEEEAAAGTSTSTPSRPISEMRQLMANKIVEAIGDHPRIIDWDKSSGTVSLRGVPIPDSDIEKILNYITKGNPSKTRKPPGVGPVLETMGMLGVDKSLIPNKELKQILEQSEEATMTRKRVGSRTLSGRGGYRGGGVKWIKLFP